MRLWRSQGRYKKQNLVYVTYEKHPDIYVKCDRKALDNWMQSCELNWLDGEVMHKLSLAGDWVDKAPIVVERYRATIKSPQP
ncbi:hypothetical protein SAMN06295910_2550 [Allosphingosinicella indica]|uniref:Uncharacterized protein n=2 Tax=Allosphingosinicella indica TaxID=941907 RepID=A0A1X7H1A3_9SPHN|nr:hypothetical protein SAMN06295910_2550 [Allosphingosinicella indica]